MDLEDLSAESVAAKVNLPARQLFKTLVADGDRHGMAVIPGDSEFDLKALAAASGDRRIRFVPVKDLQRLTGYVRGGVTVLGAKKAYPVYTDKGIEQFRCDLDLGGHARIADSPGTGRLPESYDRDAS